jgi:MerR family transcriptional regulator, heat shock protein HspR
VTADETSVVEVDDQDFPAVTMGQAAQLLEVRPAFLRSLDAAGVLTPQRSEGGHRRYSRRQLALAARLRELFDEGMTLEAATRIVALQDELTLTREQLNTARDQLGASRTRELDAARDQLAVARARVADLEARNDAGPTAAPADRPEA